MSRPKAVFGRVEPDGRNVTMVDDMVYGFQDEQERNSAGRAARAAGYECRGTNVSALNPTYLLTIFEAVSPRRVEVDRLIHDTVPSAHRLT